MIDASSLVVKFISGNVDFKSSFVIVLKLLSNFMLSKVSCFLVFAMLLLRLFFLLSMRYWISFSGNEMMLYPEIRILIHISKS